MGALWKKGDDGFWTERMHHVPRVMETIKIALCNWQRAEQARERAGWEAGDRGKVGEVQIG